MSAIWNTYRIEDIADKITIGPFGSRMKSDTYVESGVPVIRGTNLTGSKKFSGDWVFITEKLAKQLENCCVSNGDLVFPHRGSIGEVGLVDNQFPQYMMSSSLMKLRCNPNIADSEFIYYFFKSHQGRYELLKNASQVGTPGIGQPLTSLKNIEIKLPSLREQRKIVKILSDLDEKIHLNNQINQTLESIAQAIFKSWFIDFDPVRAKIAAKQEGKDSELAAMCAISGKSEAELEQMAKEDFAELQATAALFPDELVESELGEVPKGWEITNINAVTASIFSGGTPSTKDMTYWNGEIPWLSSGETRNKIIVSTEKSITETAVKKSSTKLAIFGDILIASAGQGHTRGQTSFNAIECYINQSIVALRANDKVSPYWLYYCLEPRYDEMRSLSDSHSSRGSLTTKLLASMPVILPTKELVLSFDKLIKSMLTQQVKNLKETKILKETRDALLPKLLSGEIDVSALQDEVA